ncbi:MAG: hypothetical protein KI790_15705 [Cyclobacteriaceae bacterium]|nr:hypothetical protein [Cyclobacteriaceae bacterium HetDA_MAG_MS6]
MLRKIVMATVVVIGFTGTSAFAQDTFTDEDLKTYAVVMKWAEGQKKEMGAAYNGWIKESEQIGAKKFSEMRKAHKKGELDAVEATEEEKQAFADIQAKNDEQKGKFKETFTAKIKDEIGVGLYNKLKKALKTDTDLKARYDGVMASLDEDSESEADDSGSTGN